MALLEAILEGLSDAHNGALRELCANATREFLLWSAKHVPVASSSPKGGAKPGAAAGENLNAGSLLRRLYERLAHPEPYQRWGFCMLPTKTLGAPSSLPPPDGTSRPLPISRGLAGVGRSEVRWMKCLGSMRNAVLSFLASVRGSLNNAGSRLGHHLEMLHGTAVLVTWEWLPALRAGWARRWRCGSARRCWRESAAWPRSTCCRRCRTWSRRSARRRATRRARGRARWPRRPCRWGVMPVPLEGC